MTLTDAVLAGLAAQPPPTSAQDLSSAIGFPLQNVRVRISELLRSGKLSVSDIPWRANAPAKPRKGRSADLGRRLEQILEDDDKDRVAAARALIELRSMGMESFSPVTPGDLAGMKSAMVRIMVAAGPELTDEARKEAFPGNGILEVVNAEGPSEGGGAPPC